MEDWRDLAVTVPGNLMLVADGATGLLETVRTAHRKLAACVHVLRILERGGAFNADDVQEAPSARAFLDDARRELVRLRELHDTANHVFNLYDTLLDLKDEPGWHRWKGHSGDTSRRACHALQGLRSATSHVLASRNALLVARSFPHLSADGTVWISAAVNLLRLAMGASAMAMFATLQIRYAVTEELEDAWMVLFLLYRNGATRDSERRGGGREIEESSAEMAEDWKDLVGTVPGTLILVADGTTGLLETVRTAHRKLAACVRVLRILERGGAINADDVQEAPSARAFLEDNRSKLVRLRELHDTASHVFLLYDTLLRLKDEPRWRHWERHSGETSGHACHALQGLRSATSHLLASRNALLMARSFPHLSADWPRGCRRP